MQIISAILGVHGLLVVPVPQAWSKPIKAINRYDLKYFLIVINPIISIKWKIKYANITCIKRTAKKHNPIFMRGIFKLNSTV